MTFSRDFENHFSLIKSFDVNILLENWETTN